MKAIVLSCDAYHVFAHHMIVQYMNKWPNNPFVFRVPYNTEYPHQLKADLKDKVELVHTDQSIKNTVLTLLDGLDKNEWIFWSIDDKYIRDILVKPVENILQWLPSIKDERIAGIAFARSRTWRKRKFLRMHDSIVSPTGEHFIGRANYNHIWYHQFLRVKVLKDLFESFPNHNFRAKEMDLFIRKRPVDPTIRLYVSKNNYVVFGESTTRGKITKTAFKSFKRNNFNLPPNIDMVKKSIRIGFISPITRLKYHTLMRR